MEQFINKHASEKLNHEFDFRDELTSGASISSRSVTALDSTGASATSTIVSSSAISGTKVTAVLQAGTSGQTYRVTFQATASDAEVLEKVLVLRVNDNLQRNT